MKKTICGFVLIAFCMVACESTPEDKAVALIKASKEKSLVKPATYEPIETRLDSAFSPYDSPAFYELVLEIANEGNELKRVQREVEMAKSGMAIWGESRSVSAYFRNEYNDAKAKYDESSARLSRMSERFQRLAQKMQEMVQATPAFVGFKAEHTFRAENNAGQTLVGRNMYYFDKDLTRVEAFYDMDDEAFVGVQKVAKRIQEAVKDSLSWTEAF